ncbi:GNAT family N-acetyltransferase [Streptomyces qinzhouensis]|uniref:GNAT family N-acetyltransferase n=1 Tax=Streptomyces qinzhouensis TaxID=2599401 RepID=A0A5B8J651_9ACTN|nr:GNAT family N-acetyltransferase [Streptomyces qinzhouensis]QDY75904.1 GNAT family N-acetyltransferase [Streptomyces qinzhouensis]
MTTTLRPAGPARNEPGDICSRGYDICVNGRRVGGVEIATMTPPAHRTGTLQSLFVEPADRHRGRATVAALAAEEVLRAWGCDEIRVSVPPAARAATRLVTSLGYTRTGWKLEKLLAVPPPALPEGLSARAEGPNGGCVLLDGETEAGRFELVMDEDRARLATAGISGPLRGRGYGRALVRHAEGTALAAGARRLALSVPADDAAALRLAAALGYRATDVHWRKPLL